MSALGTTREAVWHGLVSGRCGIASVTQFDTTGYRSQLAAEIPAYTRDAAYSEMAWRRPSRSDQVAIIASREALDDAGVLEGDAVDARMGVLLGSVTENLLGIDEWFAEVRRVGV